MRRTGQLDPKKRYLQVALNNTLDDAVHIVRSLPVSERIILEAGTPLLKRYGVDVLHTLRRAASSRGFATRLYPPEPAYAPTYIVADLKTMDRAETEVAMVARAGANAAVALGVAPTETLDAFVNACREEKIDAMIDMMNVSFPLTVLRSLKHPPQVAIVHRGVDEERFNKEKQVPYHEIQRIKSSYDIMVAIAGGDTLREAQRAIFNDADIVVVWKSVYQHTSETASLVEGFLKEVE